MIWWARSSMAFRIVLNFHGKIVIFAVQLGNFGFKIKMLESGLMYDLQPFQFWFAHICNFMQYYLKAKSSSTVH